MKKIILSISLGLLMAMLWLGCSNSGPLASGTSEQPNALTGIVGRAVDKNGNPVSGADAVLITSQPAGAPFYGVQTVTYSFVTTQEGTFNFKTVPPGNYSIFVSIVNKDTINDQRAQASLRKIAITLPDTSILLPPDTLKPASAIRGMILPQFDGADVNFKYFQVIVLELGKMVVPDLISGEFFFPAIPAGTYTIRIQSNYHDYSIIDTGNITVTSTRITNLGPVTVPLRDFVPVGPQYVSDTLAVRAILDANGITASVKAVTWVKNGRIAYFNCSKPIYIIPDAVSQLSGLEYLSITGAGASFAGWPPLTLSSRLAELDALKRLVLTGYNKLHDPSLASAAFPAGRLKSLEALEIGQNALDTFPPWILNLSTLKTLDISNCGFSGLPVEITGLNCLIDIGANRLCADIPQAVVEWLNKHYYDFQGIEGSGDTDWLDSQNCY